MGVIGPNLVNRSAEPRPSDSNKTTRVERFDGSITGLGSLIPVLVSSGSKGGPVWKVHRSTVRPAGPVRF